MSSNYSADVIQQTVKLLKEYESQKVLCAVEFIDSKDLQNIPKEVSVTFFNLIKHQNFLSKLLNHVLDQYSIKRPAKWILESILYLLIFTLSESNYDEIKCTFLNIRFKFPLKVIQFLIQEENVVLCAKVAAKYFDRDYILNNIIHPLLNNEKLLKIMKNDLAYEFNERTSVMPKKITMPVTPIVFRKKIMPHAPVNSRIALSNFQASKIPDYKKQGQKLQKSLVRMKNKNWDKALKLLETAQNCPFKCALPQKPKISEVETETYRFRSKGIPKFKHSVAIKKNGACLMREAAMLVKRRESELKRLEELLSGGFDDSKISALEEEICKTREQQNIQEIERKHLEGLLTFEEAQLARKKVRQANQENMEKFKEERIQLLQELFDWKVLEREKIRKLVEKSHEIEKSAKEAEQKLLEEKQSKARLINYESKKISQEIHQKREEELAEKVKLIQELRSLQQLRSLNVKEFDPTKCPNFGLMCEMSIAELRERLNMLKIEMQEELEERRKVVLAERERKEHLLDNVKEFISQSRTFTSKPIQTTSLKLEETTEILTLRERLQQAKQMNAVLH